MVRALLWLPERVLLARSWHPKPGFVMIERLLLDLGGLAFGIAALFDFVRWWWV
jgi:hypothetical protein